MTAPRTLFDKIWDEHVIDTRADGAVLLAVDRHMLHEITSPPAFAGLRKAGRRLRNPELTAGTIDHIVATRPGRTAESYAPGAPFIREHRAGTAATGVRLFDLDDPRQGIAHVVAPETGIALPGTTLVCGDSHTCTVGALGCIAFGVGSSEVEHVMATQALWIATPRRMRVTIEGAFAPHVSAKDAILHIIGALGAGAGNGHAVEYAGSAVRAMGIEARLTLCNMSIEFGARIGFVAPDEATFAYLKGREFAPTGALWEAALAHWRTLRSDDGAVFDCEHRFDAAAIAPTVSWGTSPEDTIPVDGTIPDPAASGDARRAAAKRRALDYMGLSPGQKIAGLPIRHVFIGSCANSRLSDLEAAAAVARGRKVAQGVRAMVVPGSSAVKRAAEAKGLHETFRAAGFEWHESGCSMCSALGEDVVGRQERCVSTSNRNFEGRQGPDSRTHLASPAMAAAAAVAGAIVDVRGF